MVTSTSEIQSQRASIYLQQLCKHFAHKLPVTYGPESGEIKFSIGTCRLSATAERLELRAEAGDATRLAELQDVVARHLVRFAFREAPSITWHPQPT